MSRLVSSHWWLLFFVLFFPLLIMYIYADFIRGSELNARFGWLILLGGIAYLLRHTALQKLMLGIIVLMAISGSLDILYAVTFGGVFVSASFEAVVLTDMHEAFEFLQAYASIENIAVFTIYWLIAFYSLKRIFFKEPVFARQKILAALGVLMLLVALQQINQRGRTFDTIPGFTGVAIDYLNSHESIEEVVKNRRLLYKNSVFQASLKSDKPQTYVVVIGESLGRKHLSLYGYQRATTPNLESNLSEMIVFENTISAFSQTKPSLSVNLTEKDTVNHVPVAEALSLVGVFKRAGFKTFWLSNQQPLRLPTKPIAAVADQQHFISHDFHGVEVRRYDGFLLPSVKEALEDKAKHKVIFVHLMGSHLQYENRFPADEVIFSGKAGINAYTDDLSDSQLDYINAYDNSVHYTDFVLGEMINELKNTPAITGLIYWSDHGEEVFDTKDFKGHSPDGVTSSMLEVPFLFWRNPVYQNEFTKINKTLASHIDAPIMLDDFFHIAQCMIPIKSDTINLNKSLCLADYQVKSRRVYGKDYDKEIQ